MYRYLAALAVTLVVCWGIKWNGEYVGVKVGFSALIYLAAVGCLAIIDDLFEAVQRWRG